MKGLKPKHYRLHIEPDLRNFTFLGNVEVTVESEGPVTEISLHTMELAVWRCQVRAEEDYKNCTFVVEAEKERITLALGRTMEGEICLRISYVGVINDRMAGFYRSRYLSGGREKYLAVTQFEESHARRAFPCFDHPSLKATYDVEMIVDEHLTAISNMPVLREEAVAEGKKRVEFQRTPRMSTYLLFLGVGEFAFLEDPGDVLLRVAATPGLTEQGRFGLEFGRKSLEFSEEYYGIKFPLPKLDLIAVSDFAAGAMENWGAMTFRENLLLHHPGVTSKAGEERICEVIAHEVAHQWFGNLVTPSDWKYLWLNESFATYFGYGVVGHYHPEWDVWDQFCHGQTETALARDGFQETFPIEIPGGEHLVINTSTAPIIYNKGGSILRQLEGYVGQEGFREALRYYLKRYEYACASSRDLWEAFDEVSTKPVSHLMKSWIGQAGYPLIEASREGSRLTLTQKRFAYLPHDFRQQWLIPLQVRVFLKNGKSRTLTTLLEGEETVLELGKGVAACKVNDGQTGFYRVLYPQAELAGLGRHAADKTLPAADRWGLQSDLYALVRGDVLPLEHYLDFLSHYAAEDAFLPLTSIADNLLHACLVTPGGRRDRIASLGVGLFERILADIGYDPPAEERHTTSVLRDKLLWHAVLYGSREAAAFASQAFASLTKGGKVHPDIMRGVMQAGAFLGDRPAFDWLTRRLGTAESEHERMNILAALGCFRDAETLEEARAYILREVPSRNRFVALGSMAANPHALDRMWDWFQTHLEELEQLHPVHYERVIGGILPVAGIGREEEVRAFFEQYTAQKTTAGDAIRLSLEKLAVNGRMRRS